MLLDEGVWKLNMDTCPSRRRDRLQGNYLQTSVAFLGVMEEIKLELGVGDSKRAVVLQKVGQHHVAIIICTNQGIHPDFGIWLQLLLESSVFVGPQSGVRLSRGEERCGQKKS